MILLSNNLFFNYVDPTYDYAVPIPVPSTSSEHESVFSKTSSRGSAKVNKFFLLLS